MESIDLVMVILAASSLGGWRTARSCNNGGSCSVVSGIMTGTNCTNDVDGCEIRQCEHNSTSINSNGSYTCECTDGWSGETCGLDVNECSHRPCQHNGTCINSYGSFACLCADSWMGEKCETDVNECFEEPCKNSGTCVNTNGSYYCACQEGFTGTDCLSDVNECLSLCQYNGTCINSYGSFACLCADGWTGEKCETDVNECLTEPCKNSGTCFNTNGSYYCACREGFAGTDCVSETFVTKSSIERAPESYISWILFGVLFLVDLILVIVQILQCRRRSKARQSSKNVKSFDGDRPQSVMCSQDIDRRLNMALEKMSPGIAELIKEAVGPHPKTTVAKLRPAGDVPVVLDTFTIKEEPENGENENCHNSSLSSSSKLNPRRKPKPKFDKSRTIDDQCCDEVIMEAGRALLQGLFVKSKESKKQSALLLHDLVHHGKTFVHTKLSELGCMPKLVDYLRVNEENDLQ